MVILILLISSVLYLGIKSDNLLRQSEEIGQPVPYEHTIFVDGVGTVTGKPDIATLTMGTESKGVDVASAQFTNTATMNTIIAEIKKLEISEDDIQTSGYNVYEDTNWNSETQDYESAGWIVANYITVKVRDTSKISSILAMVGSNDITNISGPTFTIDDTTNLKAEARIKAIEQAQKKAQEIADSLGTKIESAVGYSEWSPVSVSDEYQMYSSLSYDGGGPTIESGTNEVTISVSITYKLVE
ncbi:MAG: hypothetical protein UX09_C0026G0005 [Candidatus Uhrbacteria bacterium GW2011_GWE2_45_35]|uniref:26 kDa periplasmic immunogenic protein n=2 Tax=Candidatus Uhriibacteriota TaxID=1752732 RepID=A0A0G1LRZ6_9BACT|nr:MAG: hypothetical protein UW63_C0012G0006 [Candidatus Uhrbacteria bacterium GW2011_GWF2_44_350]KKU07654.1 MAG: hypothetical protein UX09_C0026G0005 [Candidatus Uhrbacteria bacterium GW2011_GWE2_45_35]